MKLSAYLFLGITLALTQPVISAEISPSCNHLYATGNPEYPPYLWRSGNDSNLVGANQIILNEIGKRLGINISLKDVGSWARAQEMAKSGQIDLIAGAFYTAPRSNYMDYISPAFLETTSVVWKRTESDQRFTAKEDLINQNITTVINNSFGQDFDEFAKENLKVTHVASLKQAFTMLTRGRTDFVLYEKHPGLAYTNSWGFQNEIEVIGTPISTEGLFLTLSKKSKCNSDSLRAEMKSVIDALHTENFMNRALTQGLQNWQHFSTEK